MRIAIPIWEDRVSPVLDTASRLLIVEIVDRQEVLRFESCMEEAEISRKCSQIRNHRIDRLICGAVTRVFSQMLSAAGIGIITGISGQVEDVLAAHLRGDALEARFAMPGCHPRLPVE